MTNKVVKGTLILSVATLFTKIIGSLFWIPFQNIAGDQIVGLYKISFPFYSILLMIASAGIPITVSKFVAERLSQEDWMGARRVLRAANLILMISGLLAFSILFFGSELISKQLLKEPATESSLKVLAMAILLVPIMAVIRGYFQGHQQMMPTGISQFIEQIVRVGTVIVLTYWMVKLDGTFSDEAVAAGATSGALTGAIAGLLVVLWYNWRDRQKHRQLYTEQKQQKSEPLLPLAKEILKYAIPISLATLVLPLIALVDSVTVPRLLKSIGFANASELFGIYGRGEPLVNVISTFSSALTLALIPAISAHVAKNEHQAVKSKISQAWLMTLVIGLPASIGLVIVAQPVNIAMYQDDQGTITLAVLAFSAIFSTLAVTSSGILQGLGYNKLPVRHLLIGALVKVIGNFIFVPMMGIKGSALAMVIAYIVVCGLNMWMVLRKTKVKVSITHNFIKPLLCTLIMAGVLILSLVGINQWQVLAEEGRIFNAIVVFVLITLGAIVYGVSLLVTKTLGERELRMLPMGNRILRICIKLKLIRPSQTTISS
ncbi:putative polysaccharide biosynthesis protein [Hazenella coriacea]|uniref:PST family polysaccharide transporter n=1 Tax=Hazenella coriacea TaxID=1179467 RepID=A0A4R3L699_9BACL|nr:polysaccharide biosynthesis protein [Hazenella coriacea]TCS93066.1 PST family polysaccharide transporter [Hazenella coriacea]